MALHMLRITEPVFRPESKYSSFPACCVQFIRNRSRHPVMVWVRTWGCDEVQCWLESYHLDHLKAAFAQCDGQVRLLSRILDHVESHAQA